MAKTKKEDNTVWIIFGIIGLWLLMNNTVQPNVIEGTTTTTTQYQAPSQQGGPTTTTSATTTTQAKYAAVSFWPETACVGQAVTGTIQTNIAFATCSITFNPNGLGWILYDEVGPVDGEYHQTVVIGTAGSAVFKATCCRSGICATSPEETLTVEVC